MVYLIKSSAFKEDEDGGDVEYFFLLKIGYTNDSGKEKRFFSYKHHNPSSKVIYEIPEATEDHEKKIQYKFRDLLYSGKEWFKYSEDIIDFFKNIKSLEDLDKLSYPHVSRIKSRLAKKIVSLFILESDPIERKKKVSEFVEDMIETLGKDIEKEEVIIRYLTGNPKINQSDLEKYILRKSGKAIYSEDSKINKEVSEFLVVYDSKKTIYEKLRLLCENGLSQEAINIVLGQMSDNDEVKSYYTVLGPRKLYSLGYNTTRIKKSLGVIVFSPELLDKTIYSQFKVGEKYTLSNLKTKLGSIYSSINYNSTPKANDIGRWFEIRPCQTTEEINGVKKRVNGYELLRSLETELRYAQ